MCTTLVTALGKCLRAPSDALCVAWRAKRRCWRAPLNKVCSGARGLPSGCVSRLALVEDELRSCAVYVWPLGASYHCCPRISGVWSVCSFGLGSPSAFVPPPGGERCRSALRGSWCLLLCIRGREGSTPCLGAAAPGRDETNQNQFLWLRVPNPQHRPAMPSLVESSEGGDEGESLRYEEMEDDNVSPTDLSELLKDGTKESHDRAENTQFVKDFLKGRIKKELFKLATVALYFTYSALEEEMDRNKDNPVFAPLYFPLELHRKEALIKDMKYFYGEDWKEKIQCSEATQHYVDRIHHVGQHEPELLVAHAYTRYMGDLSGGQVLKKVAQRALKLPSTDEGIQFYVFENISNAQQFKQLYRARLNALDLDKSCKERIVEEANRAFRFNMQVFDELDKIGKSLTEEAQEGGLPVHDGKGDLRKCPYYADKLGKAAPGCPYHAAVALAKQPLVQLILAACVAVAAGAAAWYLM